MPVVKAQVSSALRVPEPGGAAGRAFLDGFAEPRFLHQVREVVHGARRPARTTCRRRWTASCRRESEWRVHFHVPVHAAEHTTQQRAGARPWPRSCGGPAPLTRHLEVETYTWGVLPDGPGGDDGLVDGPRRRAGLDARPPRRPRSGGDPMTLVLIDAVGLTPRALAHMPRLRKLAGDGFQARVDPVLPAVTCTRAVDVPHRPGAHRPRDRRQRLVLPRPRRDLPLAPAQPARAGREAVGDGAPRQAGLQGRERLLVVRDGGDDRLHRHAAADLPRRRAQVARTATPTRPSCTTG